MSNPISPPLSFSSCFSSCHERSLKENYYVDSDGFSESSSAEELKFVRGLRPRHIQLIGLGGVIGTGLFVGTGSTLATCGPAPLLISYLIMTLLVWTIMNQLGEMVIFLPLPGQASIYALARKYLNRPLGFTVGWNVFFAHAMVAPSEVTACAFIIQYWTDAVPAIFIAIFVAATITINLLPVRYFGESEFCVAIVKIVCITGLIILGVVIFFGGAPDQHGVLGFHYWKHPGAFVPYLVPGNTGRFLATWTAIVKSGFAFILTPEVLASCAAEAQNPRKSMAKAFSRVVYRFVFFYICGVIVIGVIVASNNSRLLSAISEGKSSAAASPFVIGIQEVGIRGLPHVINVCLLTSAYSCGTSHLYAATRSLHSMAVNGDAPRVLAKMNRFGVPIYSVGVACLFPFLAFLNCSHSASTVFTWLSNIVSISGFFSWTFAGIIYLRYRTVVDTQGLNDRVTYRVAGMRYCAYFTMIFYAILGFTNGYYVFFPSNWSLSNFFASYISVLYVSTLLVGSTIYYKQFKFYDPDTVPIMSSLLRIEEEERMEDVPAAKSLSGKIFQWLF